MIRRIAYISHDSLVEGIGMSQIRPLVKMLAAKGWNVSLVTMEKVKPSQQILAEMESSGIKWTYVDFGKRGPLNGILRILRLLKNIPRADFYHCRGDIESIAVILRRQKFLWDVRGLWGEQKFVIGSIKRNALTELFFRFIENT